MEWGEKEMAGTGTEGESGIVNTPLATSLLLLETPDELKRMVREGWFKPLAPDRWRIISIVHGRIRALMALAQVYDAGQLANALGITRERIRQLTLDGVLKTVGPKKYNRDQATRDFVHWQRDQNRHADKSTSESRVRDARAAEIEIRTAERTRRLITLDEALDSNAMLCGIVRTELGGLAARVTRDLALRRDIEKAVNDSLARIAHWLNAEAESLEVGRDADDAVADDDAGPMGGAQSQLPANGRDPRSS